MTILRAESMAMEVHQKVTSAGAPSGAPAVVVRPSGGESSNGDGIGQSNGQGTGGFNGSESVDVNGLGGVRGGSGGLLGGTLRLPGEVVAGIVNEINCRGSGLLGGLLGTNGGLGGLKGLLGGSVGANIALT